MTVRRFAIFLLSMVLVAGMGIGTSQAAADRGGTGGLTIAERRAAARAAEQKAASTTDTPVDAPAQESEPESGRTEGNEH